MITVNTSDIGSRMKIEAVAEFSSIPSIELTTTGTVSYTHLTLPTTPYV